MTLSREKVPPDEEFLGRFIDAGAPLEVDLAGMEPEDVIRIYWSAVDSGDYARAYACESKVALFRYLFANMDDDRHANETFAQAFSDGLDNYESVEVMSIEPVSHPLHVNTENARFFSVRVNQDLKVEMTTRDGPMIWFMSLVRTPTGWRIAGYGTGP